VWFQELKLRTDKGNRWKEEEPAVNTQTGSTGKILGAGTSHTAVPNSADFFSSTGPCAFVYFSGRVICFLPELVNPNSPTSTFHVAGITGVCTITPSLLTLSMFSVHNECHQWVADLEMALLQAEKDMISAF
jgi:hypothetical protein